MRLFPFLDLQKLSEDRLDDLCEIYSNSDENTHQYFDYLKCNLNLIREINKRKKNLEETNDDQKNKMDKLISTIESLQKQFSDSEKVNDQLLNQLNDSKELINEQQNKTKELETKVTSLQKQSIESDNINNQLKNQLKDSKDLINEQQNKMKELESQVSQLQNKLTSSEKEMNDVRKQLDEIFLIKGTIDAKVENGLIVSAEINLKEKSLSLDTSKSKFIISTSGEKSLGKEAYEKGDPITSLHMKTSSYLCRPGTFFVRCIVFNSNGKSNEIVSNSVTTSGSCASFGYEGKPSKISLYKGKYKLEVWGAKGGDSTGKGYGNPRKERSLVQGGLGGYSRGVLNLEKNETIYVYVGGEGCPSELTEGSSTKGGFPDGGGTKTGHARSESTAVPGTGGGSTSIRIGSDTNYTRVIVAGGGGGASGCCCYVDPGGFGGGLIGGNCTYESSLKSQGAGTQTGSTRGLGCGDDRHGNSGQFGLGATNNYSKGCDSGGGGGGGWYGGGSGGYGYGAYCSSGGGGSGWTFTESSLKNWQSGDSANASKFALNSSYYLSDVACIGGNEDFPSPDGNGTEHGHNGKGFAKITPL